MARRTYHTREDLTDLAIRIATDEQKSTLEKCLKVGWRIMKVANLPGKDAVINVQLNGTAAFIMPDGKLDRSRRVRLPN